MTDRALLQRALDALTAARDSVSNELSGIINHPSNARIIECVTDDLAKADASIAELRAALAAPVAPAALAAKAAAFDWLLANCIEEEDGWMVVRFETARQLEKHLPDHVRWVANDIAEKAGVDLDAERMN